MASRRQTESPNKAEAVPARPEPATIAKAAAPKRKSAPRKKAAKPAPAQPPVEISEDARRGMIAQAAYLRAERRGFMPGDEVEDWLAAEAEVDALLRAGPRGTPQ